jgi:adenine-specific DNA-methyltransferase
VQQLQETLFHEKQLLIENCLFGVDINPNSVKICRLRLWIELLKNAYYVTPSVLGSLITNNPITNNQLETLPNIDINIKQGNSLISRFKLDDDLSEVFKKQKFSYKAYRKAVEDYKNTNSKEAKTELLSFISDIKEQFQTVFHSKIKENKELSKFRGQLYNLQNQGDLFGGGVDKTEADRLEKLVAQFEQKVKDIKGNIIYRDAFEWRFEFPEVLDNDGGYLGFDVVIGNPPYVRSRENFDNEEKEYYINKYSTASYQLDLYKLFIEGGCTLLRENKGILSFITPSVFLANDYDEPLRKFIIDNFNLSIFTKPNDTVFDEANVAVTIFLLESKKEVNYTHLLEIENKGFSKVIELNQEIYEQNYLINPNLNKETASIVNKLNKFKKVEDDFDIKNGIKVRKELLFDNKVMEDYKPFMLGRHVNSYEIRKSGIFVHYIKENESLYTNQAFRTPDIFEQPKIIVRQILGNRIISSYDNEQIYTDQTTYLILDKNKNERNLQFVLGLLNSKLVYFYFKNTMADNKDLFPKIKRSNLLLLPIVQISESEQQPLITLVEEIIAIKKATPSVSTAEKEGEIDRLVYGLYGLTVEEIGIVEGAVK